MRMIRKVLLTRTSLLRDYVRQAGAGGLVINDLPSFRAFTKGFRSDLLSPFDRYVNAADENDLTFNGRSAFHEFANQY